MRKRPATRGTEWSGEEMQIMDRVYPTGGTVAVMALLPHRTRSQIKNYAQRWGLATSATSGSAVRDDFSGVPVHEYTVADEVARAWRAPKWANREQPMRWRVAA